MSTADIEHWTARVAQLERELDAETKLSKVNLIAGEWMRTREALKKAKAKLGRAGRHPKREKSAPSALRNGSTATGRANS